MNGHQVAGLEQFLAAAKAAGCPTDQVRRFAAAGYAAQPKQLRFHALARAADAAGRADTDRVWRGARWGEESCDAGADRAGRLPTVRRDQGAAVAAGGEGGAGEFEDLRGRVLGGVPHDYRRPDGVLEFANG